MIGARFTDFVSCLRFYTRLPTPTGVGSSRSFSEAQWAAPISGALIGLVGALAFSIGAGFGLPSSLSAALALGTTIMTTGALHEDGLADVADGFGGGNSREKKLAIMRDSRIGTYGTLALLITGMFRWAAIAALTEPTAVFLAMIAAHGASRSLFAPFMHVVPAARSDGLSSGVGAVSAQTAMGALAIGILLMLPLGIAATVAAIVLLSVWFFFWKWLCRRQVGGHTGDTLGALQQGSEILVLSVAVCFLI